MVMSDFGDSEGRGIVELPTTKSLSPRETYVPATVMAGALVVRVAPAMATPFESRVASGPAVVMTVAGDGDGPGANIIVLDPICSLDWPRDTIVPSILLAGSLGFRV